MQQIIFFIDKILNTESAQLCPRQHFFFKFRFFRRRLADVADVIMDGNLDVRLAEKARKRGLLKGSRWRPNTEVGEDLYGDGDQSPLSGMTAVSLRSVSVLAKDQTKLRAVLLVVHFQKKGGS